MISLLKLFPVLLLLSGMPSDASMVSPTNLSVELNCPLCGFDL